MKIKNMFVPFRFVVLTLIALVMVFGSLPAQAETSAGTAPAEFEVVAEGLLNPRGLAFDADGNLLIAESGSGGDGVCISGPEGEVCYGETGRISKVEFDAGRQPVNQDVIVSGLSSLGLKDTGDNAVGPHDVAIDNLGDMYILMGLGADPALRDPAGPLGAAGINFGQLVAVDEGGSWSNVLDIAGYEAANNPDEAQVDSNPFAILTDGDTFKVVDAGGNSLLDVTLEESAGLNSPEADISAIATFDTRLVEFPPGTGEMIPMDAVPTAVEIGPDSAYYVSQLTGFPFPVGGANIFRVVPGEEPEVYASGFTNVLDLAFGPDGSLYVLEMAKDSLLGPPPPMGRIIQVAPSGVRTVIGGEGLIAPVDMEMGPDYALYVANLGTSAGGGQVVRIPLPTSQVTIEAAKDNTLYESETGALSNGVGEYFFAGKTNNGAIRRGLVGFDIAQVIPDGGVVISAALDLHMSKTIAGDMEVSIHKYLKEWGEGNSDAVGDEGAGAAAATGDATWLHTSFDTALWDSPGGDFAANASAITTVGGIGSYQWSSPVMAADLQSCLAAGAGSCGWLVMGDESENGTAKRFGTRENGTEANRPVLTVEYITPLPDYAVFAPVITNGE